jgi:hypothetical protein
MVTVVKRLSMLKDYGSLPMRNGLRNRLEVRCSIQLSYRRSSIISNTYRTPQTHQNRLSGILSGV